MFAKKFSVTAQNPVSKKDLKKLKSDILEQYPRLTESDIKKVLPEDGNVMVQKLDNRCLLYQSDGHPPAFFDFEQRGEIFPTCYALWRLPPVIMDLQVHAPVSKFVLKGADVMLPGVLAPEKGFGYMKAGQPRVVTIPNNPYSIAVGKVLVSTDDIAEKGMKGKAMQVLHTFRDELWVHCGKEIPNKGFGDEEVCECADRMADAAAVEGEEFAQEDVQKEPTEEAPPPVNVEATASSPAVPTMAPDELLDFCFLFALKTSLAEDKAFPIEAGDMYAKHMLPARPEGTTLDVKQTSHKQIGKYLNAMRKKKIIDVVEKKGVISVKSVDRKHKLLTEFVVPSFNDAGAPPVVGAGGYPAASPKAAAAPKAAAGYPSAGSSNKTGRPAPAISIKYKPSHYTEGLYKAAGLRKDELLAWEDCCGVLDKYLKQQDLVADGEQVALDELLTNALFVVAGGKKKDAEEPPTSASVLKMQTALKDRMQMHTVVEVEGLPAYVRKGELVKIQIATARKGAHNITRCTGLETFSVEPEVVAEALKKKLNCTTSVEKLPGNNVKDKVMQLQGHAHQEIIEYLQKEYNIDKKYIDLKLK